MRFIIDMPLSPGLAKWLNHKGHDCVHASKIGYAKASDSEIMEFAKLEERIIITADLDYPLLLAYSKSDYPAIVLFQGGNFSEKEIINQMSKLLSIASEEEITQSIIVLDKNRIRRRKLPL